jgi:molybdenum-dependent DNA-binding transcriptional regulator ModE
MFDRSRQGFLLEAIERKVVVGRGTQHRHGYRRAWNLLDDLNQSFAEPVVSTTTGGFRRWSPAHGIRS